MNDFRPPTHWNFFEDGISDNKVEHVLRYNADPSKAYSDGRIDGTDEILDLIQAIGNNLKGYEEVSWKQLFEKVHDIFSYDYGKL